MLGKRKCCCGPTGSCVFTFEVSGCGGTMVTTEPFAGGRMASPVLSISDHETSTLLDSGTMGAHPTDADSNRLALGWDLVEHKSAPTTAATVAVTTAAGSLQAGTYRVAYTWVDDYGETTMGGESAPFTVSGTAQKATITLPSRPVLVGAIKLYMTDGAPGTEVLYTSGLTGTTYVPAFAFSAATPIPTSNTSGLSNPSVQATVDTVPASGGAGGLNGGGYYIAYSFVGGGGQTTLGTSLSDIFSIGSTADLATVTLPSLPVGATGMHVYLYGYDGGPSELGRIASNVTSTTLAITDTLMASAPFSGSPSISTSSLANPSIQATVSVGSAGGGTPGLQAGTFYLAYTFKDATGETAAGSSQSAPFTRTDDTDVSTVTLPSLPGGATGIDLYVTDGASGTGRRYVRGVTTTTYDLSTTLAAAGTPPPASNTTAPTLDFEVVPTEARLQTRAGTISVPCGSTVRLPPPIPDDRYHCVAHCPSPAGDHLTVTITGSAFVGTYDLDWVRLSLEGSQPEIGYWGAALDGSNTFVLDQNRNMTVIPADSYVGVMSVTTCPPGLAGSGVLASSSGPGSITAVVAEP